MDKNPKHKSGFQGRESKRRRDFEKAASDPKQKKLFEHSGPSTLCEPSSQPELVSFEPITSEATPLQSSTEIPSAVIASLPTELTPESHLKLSRIQVLCERIFSVLMVIKTRIRSSIGQELLESFILFYVNRTFNFDYERAIDTVASSSSELSRNLKL